MTGWKIIAWSPVSGNLGGIENTIHHQLSHFFIGAEYVYSGGVRNAQEIFRCDRNEAVDRIGEAIATKWTFA